MKYPLNSMAMALTFHPFTWGAHWHRRKDLTEAAKKAGATQWWVRLGCFTLAYHRMI